MSGKKRDPSDEFSTAESVSDLANEFMRDLGEGKPSGPSYSETKIASANQRKTRSPLTTALFGLLFWGGGFLFIGWWLTFFLILSLLALLASFFLAMTGMAPDWFARGALDAIRWGGPIWEGLALFGGSFAVVWWLSIVIPIQRALWLLPRSFLPEPHWTVLFLTAPFPILGDYSRGNIRRGHLDALAGVVFLISSLSILTLWKKASSGVTADVATMEPYFLGFLGAAVLSGIEIIGAIVGRVIGALHEMGVIKAGWEGGKTDWKFVILASVLIVGVVGYGVVGAPGRMSRTQIVKAASKVERQGYVLTGEWMRKGVDGWERGLQKLHLLLNR